MSENNIKRKLLELLNLLKIRQYFQRQNNIQILRDFYPRELVEATTL